MRPLLGPRCPGLAGRGGQQGVRGVGGLRWAQEGSRELLRHASAERGLNLIRARTLGYHQANPTERGIILRGNHNTIYPSREYSTARLAERPREKREGTGNGSTTHVIQTL